MPRPGSTTARGYDHRHRTERKRWAPAVAAGRVVCWRCRRLIAPGQRWDLGHDDTDPAYRRYAGPEHTSCNRSAGATKGNRSRRVRRAPRLTSTGLRW